MSVYERCALPSIRFHFSSHDIHNTNISTPLITLWRNIKRTKLKWWPKSNCDKTKIVTKHKLGNVLVIITCQLDNMIIYTLAAFCYLVMFFNVIVLRLYFVIFIILNNPVLDTRISVFLLCSSGLCDAHATSPGFWKGVDWRALVKY